MKTKKSLSEKLDLLYRMVAGLSNLVEKQDDKLKTLRLELSSQAERIQLLEAMVKEMVTQNLTNGLWLVSVTACQLFFCGKSSFSQGKICYQQIRLKRSFFYLFLNKPFTEIIEIIHI